MYLKNLKRAITGTIENELKKSEEKIKELHTKNLELTHQVLALTEQMVSLQKKDTSIDERSWAFQIESFRRFVASQDPLFQGDDWFERFKGQYLVDKTKLKVYRLIAASLPNKDAKVEEVIDAVSRKGNQLSDLFRGISNVHNKKKGLIERFKGK